MGIVPGLFQLLVILTVWKNAEPKSLYEYPDYEELPKSEAWKETAEPDQIALVEKYTGKIFKSALH